MAAVPINSPAESYEDDSMEDEPSESENTNGETEANGTKDEFWALKTFLGNMVADDLISDYFVFEKAKLIRDEKAKELNDKCNALCTRELELCSYKFGLFADALSLMKL